MFKSPFSFSGRIRRLEYGLTIIIYFVAAVLIQLVVVGGIMASGERGGGAVFLTLLLFVPLIIFVLAQGVKRSHDIGNSGWFVLIPFYGLWLLFADSKEGVNKWGPNPKGIGNETSFSFDTPQSY